MSCIRYLVPLLVSLALLDGSAWAEEPVISPPEDRIASSGIDSNLVAMALATGAGIGAMGALVAGDALLTVGAGTVIAIYVGHLLLELIVVGGAVYVWPDSEETVDPVPRPLLKSKRTMGHAELRLVTSY